MTSDIFPRPAVGSVVGFGGMAGAVSGMVIAAVVATILEVTGSYVWIFAIASSMYLIALRLRAPAGAGDRAGRAVWRARRY